MYFWVLVSFRVLGLVLFSHLVEMTLFKFFNSKVDTACFFMERAVFMLLLFTTVTRPCEQLIDIELRRVNDDTS